MCLERALGIVEVGTGAVIVARGIDVIGDMATEERGEVMVEEE